MPRRHHIGLGHVLVDKLVDHKHSSSSSSSSSDDEFKHLPKQERKMRKKMKKQMKKGKIPPGAMMAGGAYGADYGHQGAQGSMPPGGYPVGYAPPPAGYPAGGAYPGVPPAGGAYPAGQQYPQQSYPAGSPAFQPSGQYAAGYPPGDGAYPPAGGAYPQAGGAYPQAGGAYPQAGGAYPPAGGAYPQAGGAYPQTGGAYPPAGGAYPPAGGAYPPAGGAYPPAGGAYPPAGGAYPPSAGGYVPPQGPSFSGGMPPGGVAMPPQGTYEYGGQAPQCPPGQVGGPSQSYGVPPNVAAATSGMSHMNLGKAEVFRPTIRPANPFSAEKDSDVLRKAMKGLGTDEKAIVAVICNRSNCQRQDIAKMFKTMHGKDLMHDLKSELSGDLEEAILALFKPSTYYDAYCLHKAMSCMGTKDSILIEIMCTRTNAEIHGIIQTYKTHFHRNLEEDIMSDTSGHFKRLLVSACQGNRTELTPAQQQQVMQQGPASIVDSKLAHEDAQKLYQAGEGKVGTDESAFLTVMAVRHLYQLRATFEEYQRISGRDIRTAIGKEMSGDVEDGFKALVMCARNRPEYFADRLHKAMKGVGTDDSTVIRVVTSRSEIDLQDIKEVYLVKYGKTLNSAIASETSGDFKRLLLGIIGQ